MHIKRISNIMILCIDLNDELEWNQVIIKKVRETFSFLISKEGKDYRPYKIHVLFTGLNGSLTAMRLKAVVVSVIMNEFWHFEHDTGIMVIFHSTDWIVEMIFTVIRFKKSKVLHDRTVIVKNHLYYINSDKFTCLDLNKN